MPKSDDQIPLTEAPVPKSDDPIQCPEAPVPKSDDQIPLPEAPEAKSAGQIPLPEAPAPKSDDPIPLPEAPVPKSDDPIPLPDFGSLPSALRSLRRQARLLFSPSPSLLVWITLLPRGDRSAASCSGRKKEREQLHGESAAGGGPPQEPRGEYPTGRFLGRGIFRPSGPAQGEALAKGLKPGLGQSRSLRRQPPLRGCQQGA